MADGGKREKTRLPMGRGDALGYDEQCMRGNSRCSDGQDVMVVLDGHPSWLLQLEENSNLVHDVIMHEKNRHS